MADIEILTLTVGLLMSRLSELPANLPVHLLAYPGGTRVQGTVHHRADGTPMCVVIGTNLELDLYQLALTLGLDPETMAVY